MLAWLELEFLALIAVELVQTALLAFLVLEGVGLMEFLEVSGATVLACSKNIFLLIGVMSAQSTSDVLVKPVDLDRDFLTIELHVDATGVDEDLISAGFDSGL